MNRTDSVIDVVPVTLDTTVVTPEPPARPLQRSNAIIAATIEEFVARLHLDMTNR